MITLKQMEPQDFDAFLEITIQDYAHDKIVSGTWAKEKGLANAKHDCHKLLPQGLNTPNHHFFTLIHNDSQNVGVIWFALKNEGIQKYGFIYDIRIYPDFQGKGVGKKAMLALEEKALIMGVDEIKLHVFGHNKRAISLYEKLGYIVTDLSMSKTLSSIQ